MPELWGGPADGLVVAETTLPDVAWIKAHWSGKRLCPTLRNGAPIVLPPDSDARDLPGHVAYKLRDGRWRYDWRSAANVAPLT
jgi:hypothetical protein